MSIQIKDFFRKRKQGELTGQETEFLPAVLEVTETPPSPVGRMVMWTIMGLLVVGLLWACFGKVDEVAIATGKIIPSGQVKVMQAEDKGVIKTIYVKEGQLVKKGDVLLELDETFSAADVARLRKEVAYYTVELERLMAEKTGVVFQPGSLQDLDPKDLDGQLNLYRSRLQEYRTKQAAAEAQIRQTTAALESSRANRLRYDQQLTIAKDKEDRMKKLIEENAVALFQMMDYQARRMDLEQSVAMQNSEIARLEGALSASLENLAAVQAEWMRDIDTKLADTRKQLFQSSEQLKKANEKNRLSKIVAPVDGRVSQLAVHTVGGVVKEAQSLVMVVPEDVTMEAEVWAANKDIGFLQPGQKAELKVETFNFQKYGTVDGIVSDISPDAVEDPQDKEKSMRYRVVVQLDKNQVAMSDRMATLSPGMAVTAEIKIRQKRIIEFFLDPFRQYKSEALRER